MRKRSFTTDEKDEGKPPRPVLSDITDSMQSHHAVMNSKPDSDDSLNDDHDQKVVIIDEEDDIQLSPTG